MTNQDAINELQSAIDLIKQDGKDWLDERDIPILKMAISALEAQEIRDLLPVSPLLDKKKKKRKREAISALQAQDSPKPTAESVQNVQNEDLISRKAAIDVLATMQGLCTSKAALVQNSKIWQQIKDLPSAQPEWNNHTVACLLAELFDDTCACNYNGIDEWLPEKCEVIDACPNHVGVACWEQFLKHRAERRTDDGD